MGEQVKTFTLDRIWNKLSNQARLKMLVLNHNRKFFLRLQLSWYYEKKITHTHKKTFNFYLRKIHQKDIQKWEKHHSMRKNTGIPKTLKMKYESNPESTVKYLILPVGKELSWWNRSWYGLQSQQLINYHCKILSCSSGQILSDSKIWVCFQLRH